MTRKTDSLSKGVTGYDKATPKPSEQIVNEIADPMFVTPLQPIVVARIGAQITPNELPDLRDEGHIPIHKLWDQYTVGIEKRFRILSTK